MRRVAYITYPDDDIVKLMLYQVDKGVYVFVYDDLSDGPSKCDHFFSDIEGALEFCFDLYRVENRRWISIEDPSTDCQHDWIEVVRIKGRENGKPELGRFEKFINGSWIEIAKREKVNSFATFTGNERLFISGLMTEFDKSMKVDKNNAEKILRALQWDEVALNRLMHY